ncbi:hypothetical protein G6L37_01420 [Agrobacterium rubi]|nr:hypothetical protein [Agrobacterium rubi]NTF24052.1 hypothetical protein [Agrobacterium rubi]
MTFHWSDIAISRDYGEYGIAFNAHSLHLVTLTMSTGTSFVIGNFTKPEHFPLSYFEQVVAALEQKGRDIAAGEMAGRFIDEATAYVRSRVRIASDPADDMDDPDWWESTNADILDGLRMALRQNDTYRAARQFESCVRAIEGDIEIIDLMDPILATFQADTDATLGGWVEKAASREEELVRMRSRLISAAIDRLFEVERETVMARR